MRKVMIGLTALVATVGAAAADEQDDAVVAARLVFGEGLAITVDDGAGTVKIAYGPGLDDARVRKLIETYIVPEVRSQAVAYEFDADKQLFLTDYRKAAASGGEAFVLMEPVMKGNLCLRIVEGNVHDARRAELVDWCWWSAARTARHTLHDFRGKPVTSPATDLYNGELKFADPILTEAGFVLVVPGKPANPTAQSMRVQQNLVANFDEDNRFKVEAATLHRKNLEWTRQKEAEVAAQDRKLGAGGGKVVWGKRFFGRWDPVEPVAALDSCRAAYWKAYGPPGAGEGAVFVWEMAVDGTVCKTDFIQNDRIAAGGPFFTGRGGDCSTALAVPGKHKLEVRMWATKDARTGRKNVEVSGDQLTVSDEIRSAKTKVVAQGATSCESPEGLRVAAP